MDERRNGLRHRAQKAGIITFHRSGAFRNDRGINCLVRNLSPKGARLEVASQIGIPDDFVLWSEFDDLKLPCHVVWRTATRLGVKFTQVQSEVAHAGGCSTVSPFPRSDISTVSVQGERSGISKPRWMAWR